MSRAPHHSGQQTAGDARVSGETSFDVDVLFEEDGLVAVHKPPGLATVAGAGERETDSLVGAMREAFPVEPGFSGPSIFGRLDRPTSGVVLAAMTAGALRAVEPSWSSGAIRKQYLVVVHGRTDEEGRIDVPLAARRPRHKGTGRVEAALTTYRRLASSSVASLLLAELHTGRTHQIRRHMKAIGHPVLGDDRYGHAARERDLPATPDGLMLHAWRLSHRGDVPLLPAVVEAPIPERIEGLLDALGIRWVLPMAPTGG